MGYKKGIFYPRNTSSEIPITGNWHGYHPNKTGVFWGLDV